MKKVKKWVGILALAFLIIQSAVGIINYTQTGGQQGFGSGMERMNGGGMPSQMNGTDIEDDNSADSSDTVSSSEGVQMPQNGQIPNFNRNFEEQSGSASIIRNLESGIVGLVIDGLSLLLALAWIVLSVLARRQDKNVTPVE